MRRGYRQLDHTADLALTMWSTSEEDLLAVAAEAVISCLTAGASPAAADTERTIELSSLDRGDRLVQWMNEILVAALTDGFLTRSATIELGGETRLQARVRGEAGARARITAELKSVTYHDLEIAHAGDGWRARVVIDV